MGDWKKNPLNQIALHSITSAAAWFNLLPGKVGQKRSVIDAHNE